MTASASFPRTIDALEDIFAFTSATFAQDVLDPELRYTVDFVLEELFTNVVKYGRQSAVEVRVEIRRVPGGVEVTVADDDADRFDPADAPEVDITAPLEERKPGGMGLHLVRKMVDRLDYHYDEARRAGRITFLKTLAAAKGGG